MISGVQIAELSNQEMPVLDQTSGRMLKPKLSSTGSKCQSVNDVDGCIQGDRQFDCPTFDSQVKHNVKKLEFLFFCYALREHTRSDRIF